MLAQLGAGPWDGLVFAAVWLITSLFFAHHSGWAFWKWAGDISTGLMVALAWWLTHAVVANSFEPVQIQGLTFSGPSSEWLMRVLAEPGEPWTFGLGLMLGVFLGALVGGQPPLPQRLRRQSGAARAASNPQRPPAATGRESPPPATIAAPPPPEPGPVRRPACTRAPARRCC